MQKKGISLIVLVITIIVMIILAGAIILTLNNSGIFKKAEEAVEATNLAEVKQLAELIWSDAFTKGERGVTLVTTVKNNLKEEGITEDKWNIEVTDSGINITNKKDNNENTGNTPETPAVNTFTFTIDSKTYYAEENMTWGAWVDSKYNTIRAYYGADEFSDGSSSINLGEKVYISEVYGEVPYMYISLYEKFVGGDIHTNTLIEVNGVYYATDQRGEWTTLWWYSFFIVDGHYITFDPLSPNHDEAKGTLSWIDHIAYGYKYAWPDRDMFFMAGSLDGGPYGNEENDVEKEWLNSVMWQPNNWYGEDYEPSMNDSIAAIEEMKVKLQALKNEDFIVGVRNADTGDLEPYYLCYSDGTRVKYGDDIMEFHLGEYTLVKK